MDSCAACKLSTIQLCCGQGSNNIEKAFTSHVNATARRKFLSELMLLFVYCFIYLFHFILYIETKIQRGGPSAVADFQEAYHCISR